VRISRFSSMWKWERGFSFLFLTSTSRKMPMNEFSATTDPLSAVLLGFPQSGSEKEVSEVSFLQTVVLFLHEWSCSQCWSGKNVIPLFLFWWLTYVFIIGTDRNCLKFGESSLSS
jgi:hypothetical protein